MMESYRLAGQDFYFPDPLPSLAPFESRGAAPASASRTISLPQALISRAQGWINGEQRIVETWSAPPGILLKVSGAGELYITPAGDILPGLDCETMAGPALVLALALRGTWSLHASAALFHDQVTAFVGESGQGKSTLAAHLSRADWRLVADDILPVRREQAQVQAWPRFPQLKLTVQPGLSLAEQLPLSRVCVLAQADAPELQQLSRGQALQALIAHTAGARLFDPSLLAKHLAFCSWAAARVPVYRLAYPRDWDSLPAVRKLLESIC
jgi:hypothetical protein